ncbi:MAG: WD40 repeat protein [Pirellulaceae bacterium]|jgi:WD40 repeat protein
MNSTETDMNNTDEPDTDEPDTDESDTAKSDVDDKSGADAKSDAGDKTANETVDPTQTHVVTEFKHEEPLTSLRCDPTGRWIAAGAQDLDIQLWDLKDGKKRTLKGHDSWVRSFEFSSDGTRMYSACWGGAVKAWDLTQAEPTVIYSIQAHRGVARWVRVSPDGELLATCGNDLLVRTWKASDGTAVQEFAGHKRHVYAVEFHPEGNQIVSQDLLGNLKTWNLATGKEERTVEAAMMTGYDKKFAADMGGSRDMSFRGDGTQWASAGITKLTNGFAGVQDPIIVIFDWKTGQIQQELSGTANFKGIAWGVRFHPDGFIVGAGANKNGKGELWFYKTDDKEPFHTVSLPHAARGLDLIGSDRLAVAHADGNIRIFAMRAKSE